MRDVDESYPLPFGRLRVRSTVKDGVVSVLSDGPMEDASFRLSIRLAVPVHLAASARWASDEDEPLAAPAWSMSAAPHASAAPDDVFALGAEHAETVLRWFLEDAEDGSVPGARALIGVRAQLRAAARAALAMCDPDALAVARRFHPAARWSVYGAVVENPTGRVAQLAATCPGALVLVAGFRRRGEPEGAEAILRAAVRGRPLREVVAAGVERWDALRRREDVEREWPARAEPERARDARMQALLVRRAGPYVDPEHLLVRPAPAFAPEDIPARPDRNASWFRVMASSSRALAAAGALETRLSTFVARHARAVQGEVLRSLVHASEDGAPGDEVRQLVDRVHAFARETGRRPGRKSNAMRCLAEARRWAARRTRAADPAGRLGTLLERVRTLELGEVLEVRELGTPIDWRRVARLELPPWPHGDVAVSGLELTPIRSAEALAAEGADMAHCVAMLLGNAMAGHVHVFAARAGPSRLTLAVRPRLSGGYELVEVRGSRNRGPTRAEREAVHRWLDAVNGRRSPEQRQRNGKR